VEGVGNGALAAAALYGNFDLDQTARWKNGDPVPFVYLAAAFEAIGSDSKRLVKTQQLVQFFRGILGRTPEDLLPAVYLCTNQVAPSHVGTELGIGDAILIKVWSYFVLICILG
jgi:DNA ligase-1